MKLDDCKAGDYVYGLVETFTGYNSARFESFYAKIIRVNRVTVTVLDQNGRTQRVDPYHLQDHASQDAVDELHKRGKLL
jgi:hypothetical protein